MVEAKLACVQGDGPQAYVFELLAERVCRAVLRIAEDGMAARGGLHADLMRTAGFEQNFERREKGTGIFFKSAWSGLPASEGIAPT